jgi:hypothetical protein
MSVLSQSLQQEASYLADSIPYGTRPRTHALAVLTNVQLPPEWTKPDRRGSWTRSHTSSQSRTSDELSDFSSRDGDLLVDEVDQQILTAQAIEHVAKLIAKAKGNSVDNIIEILIASIDGREEASMLDFATTKFPQLTPTHSGWHTPTYCSSVQNQDMEFWDTLAKRRKVDMPRIHTTQDSTSTASTRPSLSTRPFSFYLGDDSHSHGQSHDANNAPLNTLLSGSASDIIARSLSQRSLLRDRSPSMIPSPVLEHPLARPRCAGREDSASSLVTIFHRSPVGSMPSLGRRVSGASNVTAVRKNSGTATGSSLSENERKVSSGGDVNVSSGSKDGVRRFSGSAGSPALTTSASGSRSGSESGPGNSKQNSGDPKEGRPAGGGATSRQSSLRSLRKDSGSIRPAKHNSVRRVAELHTARNESAGEVSASTGSE